MEIRYTIRDGLSPMLLSIFGYIRGDLRLLGLSMSNWLWKN